MLRKYGLELYSYAVEMINVLRERARAWALVAFAISCTTALSLGFTFSIRSRYASTTSLEETSLVRIASANSVAEKD